MQNHNFDNTIDVVCNNDFNEFQITMNGKSFKLILDYTEMTYRLYGELPQDVLNNQAQFIKWFLKKILTETKNNNFKYTH